MSDDSNVKADNQTLSLWDCLHDGTLLQIAEDRAERTVRVRLEVGYVMTFNHLPESTSIEFLLSGVKWVRAAQLEVWPGEYDIPRELPYEEQERLRSEYYAKSRYASENWYAVSRLVSEDREQHEISNATLAVRDSEVELILEAMHEIKEFAFRQISVCAESLSISLSNGQTLTIREFLAMGEAYWEAFAARSEAREQE